MPQPEEIVLQAFEAVDTRNHTKLASISHPDVRFVWPESMWANHFRTTNGGQAASWEEVWEPFQPRAQFPTRRMDPQVIASRDNRVTVLWHQRGINAAGEFFDCEVLGIYDVRDSLLYRAQMFYFDGVATRRFLESMPPRGEQKVS